MDEKDKVIAAIRCGNVEDFDKFVTQLQQKYSAEETYSLISAAYHQLQLNNVLLADGMDFIVQYNLINLSFFSTNDTFVPLTASNIEERLCLVLEKMNVLRSLDQSHREVDAKFLYIVKFIANNLYILKQSLKSTYVTMPWEEIVFCLVIFVSAHTIQSDLNVVYRTVLSKQSILKNIGDFCKALEDLKLNFNTLDASKLNVSIRSGRQKVIAGILDVHPEFQDLYDDYKDVRDIHSLDKMKGCVDAALVADCGTREGQLTIKRSLQLLGEHLKDTLESPNLSESVSNLLLMSAPQETKQILTALRNSLAHAHILQQMAGDQVGKFYTNIQNDIKKIGIVIAQMLYSNKIDKIKIILSNIAKSEDLDEIDEYLNVFEDMHILEMPDLLCIDQRTIEQRKIEELFEKFCHDIANKTKYEENIIQKIRVIIHSTEDTKEMLDEYSVGLVMMKTFSDHYLQNRVHRVQKNNVIQLKSAALVILNKLSPQKSGNTFSYQTIHDLGNLLIKFYESVEPGLSQDESQSIINFAVEIYHILAYETNSIQWLDEFKEKVGKCTPKKKGNEPIKTKNIKKKPVVETVAADVELTQKQSELKKIICDVTESKILLNCVSKNKRFVIESLVLDILSDLDSSKCLVGSVLFVDTDAPILTGKILRNYLAHGNPLVDTFFSDSFLAVFSTARILVDNAITYEKKIGRIDMHNIDRLKCKYDKDLNVIDKQGELCKALTEGNLPGLKKCLEQGADANYRTLHLLTSLHLSARGSSLEVIQFLLKEKFLEANTVDIYGQTALHCAAAYGRSLIITLLVEEAGLIVDRTDKIGRTPLHIAALEGRAECVRELLRLGADGTIRDMHCEGTLHIAVRNNHIDSVKALLEDGNISIEDYESNTGSNSLHQAAEYGYEGLVEYLLDNGADVNVKCFLGWTALHLAVNHGHLAIVKMLINKGANINLRDSDFGNTPLNNLVGRADCLIDIVKVLLENGASVNERDNQRNQTPLHSASTNGNKEVIGLLLEHNADVDALMYNLMSPLMCAASIGHQHIVELLLEKGANPKLLDVGNSTALHYAAISGQNNVIKSLIAKGVEIDCRNNDSHTSLHIATHYGNLEAVLTLLEAGADVNLATDTGATPLHLSAVACHQEVTEALINWGANINAEDIEKFTPLNRAINSKCTGDLIQLLISKGADINTKNEENHTPLHIACFEGHINVVKCLIKNHADINLQTSQGFTPLLSAAESNNLLIAEILLDHGADIDAAQVYGLTSLCLAAKRGYKALAELLLARGADINSRGGEPLKQAIIAGTRTITELLLKKKDINLAVADNGSTFLHLSACKGNWNIGKELVKRGLEVDAYDDNNCTPLAIAVHNHHKEFVDMLLASGADVVTKNQDQLYLAVKEGLLEIVESLLKAGAKNVRYRGDKTALELAVINGHLQIVQMFFQHQTIDPNLEDESECTLLHIAAYVGCVNIAEYLMERGADVDHRNVGALKPIHIAINQGKIEVLKLFLEHGMSVNDVDVNGVTLLHYAAHIGHPAIVELLIEKGANIDSVNLNLLTAVHLAAMRGNEGVIGALLAGGAIYNNEDASGKKPESYTENEDILKLLRSIDDIFIAVELNDAPAVEQLINEGVPLDAKSANSYSLLHIAAKMGYNQICELLLRNKANPNTVGKSNKTPLHYAAKYSHYEIAKSLLANGAIYNARSAKEETPIQLAELKSILDLLGFVNRSFEKVKSCDVTVIDDLKQTQDIGTVQAVMRAMTKDGNTLIVVAIHSRFPKTDILKEMLQSDVSYNLDAVNLATHLEKYELALQLLKRILNERKDVLGEYNPGTLDIQEQIATIFYSQTKYSEALKLYQEVLCKRTQILGAKEEPTLRIRSNIALILAKQARYQEALDMFQEVYDAQRETLGEDHIDVLYTRSYLATTLDQLGKYEEAITLNQETYKKCLTVLQPDDTLTSSVLGNSAAMLISQGDYEKAYKVYEEVYEAKKKLLGPLHSDSLKAKLNMGNALAGQNQFDKTFKIYLDVYRYQHTSLGPKHADTRETRNKILCILKLRKECAYLEKTYLEIRDELICALGKDHSDIVMYDQMLLKKMRCL